jgi:hypothetical protein
MRVGIQALALTLAVGTVPAADKSAGGEKWKYAGENQGIAFYLRITDQCRDGSMVALQLISELENPVTVTFRLNDSDWRKTFTRELAAGGKDATLKYSPEEGPVCNPYIDQVYIEPKMEWLTQSEDTTFEASFP